MNRKVLIIGIIIALLAIFMVSCAKTGDSIPPDDDAVEREDNNVVGQKDDDVDDTGDNDAEQPDGIPELTDEDVLKLYDKAVEAYGWFDLVTIPYEIDNYIEAHGMQYYEVIQPGITSIQALVDYLNGIFESELTEELMDMATDRYVEQDGKLYVMPADRGTDILKGEETYDVERQSEGLIKLIVTVEIYDDPDAKNVVGYDQYAFFLEYMDGWKFKNFELVR